MKVVNVAAGAVTQLLIVVMRTAAPRQMTAMTIGSPPRVVLLPPRSLFVALNRARNHKISARECEHLSAGK
jgi:hypothetical protein